MASRIFSIIAVFSLCITATIFHSCAESTEDRLIKGNWITTDWEIVSTKEKVHQKMNFTFGNERNYSIDYGTEIEKGKYWISGGYLHTVETGKLEKKVKIVAIDSLNLQLEMNRGGQLELLSLEKVN